jgi:tRNA A37 threonylcarbamoyladenosine synthetase subunit TsaC/SUA5/YrdC
VLKNEANSISYNWLLSVRAPSAPPVFLMILKLTSENIAEAINTAISILKRGGMIAYPTEIF